MPISTPPQDYRLDPTGTSGLPTGPELLIVDDQLLPLGTGIRGNIFIRGPPCFGECRCCVALYCAVARLSVTLSACAHRKPVP
jgi:hypothetical protein